MTPGAGQIGGTNESPYERHSDNRDRGIRSGMCPLESPDRQLGAMAGASCRLDRRDWNGRDNAVIVRWQFNPELPFYHDDSPLRTSRGGSQRQGKTTEREA